MNRPFNKKRFWLIVSILLIAEALGLCLAMRWKYIFPSDEVSEIYMKYADVEGVDASFVKDFRINDSVFINVTMLEAKDSSAWALLCKDFEVRPPSPKIQYLISNGADIISIGIISESASEASTSTYKKNILAVSLLNHIITIFHTKDENECRAVVYHNYDISIDQSIQYQVP